MFFDDGVTLNVELNPEREGSVWRAEQARAVEGEWASLTNALLIDS